MTTDLTELKPIEARAMRLGKERLAWLQAFLVGETAEGLKNATGDPHTTGFFPNQIAAVLGWQRFQADEKSRQIGHSFIFSADSVARCAIEPRTTQIHISTDKWESEDKQDYCLRVIDSLCEEARGELSLKAESKQQIVVETRSGYSEIDFLAQRPPRGAERGGIYLHEMAYMDKIQAILKAARFCTAHGGFIKGCSSHEGSDTVFNKIITNAAEESGEQPYRNWACRSWPWWTCPAFCKDVESAVQLAPAMETDERVYKWGTDALIELREGGTVDDFREECECIVLDERYSYFPMELITACQATGTYWFQKADCDGNSVDSLKEAKSCIANLAHEIVTGRLNGMWLFGMDIGRYANPDVITIGHTPLEDKNLLCMRLSLSLSNMPFPQKQEIIGYVMKALPIQRGHIDKTGIGTQIAEWAYGEFGQKAMPFDFTNQSKSDIVNFLKIRMERRDSLGGRRLVIPVWTKLTKQMHSIKKQVTPSGKPVYDSERDDESHADIFFSLCLMNALVEVPEAMTVLPPSIIPRKERQPLIPHSHIILPSSYNGRRQPTQSERLQSLRR